MGSDDLREAMQRAGVVGRPDLYFLNEEGPTARYGSVDMGLERLTAGT